MGREIGSRFHPLTGIYGGVTGWAVTSVAAYILGSLLTADATRVSNLGPWVDPHAWLAILTRRPQRRDLFVVLRHRFRGSDFNRLFDYVFLAAGTGGLDDPDERREALSIAPSELTRLLVKSFDPASTAVRLHIANKDLWEQYDRLVAEAELRLTLIYPVLLMALASWQMAWWLTPICLAVAWALSLSGEWRSHTANGVLTTCLVTGVITDPQIDFHRNWDPNSDDDVDHPADAAASPASEQGKPPSVA